MNLSEILGALKEFNEPYREAQDRLETMAFEKSMIEAKFQHEKAMAIENNNSALALYQAQNKFMATDPDMIALREEKRKQEIEDLEFGAKVRIAEAKITALGESESFRLTSDGTIFMENLTRNEQAGEKVKNAAEGLLLKDQNGELNITDLQDMEGLGGEKIFDYELGDIGKGVGTAGVAALSLNWLAGASKAAPHPAVRGAGYFLTAALALPAVADALETTAEIQGAVGKGYEDVAGMSLLGTRQDAINAYLKDRGALLINLQGPASEISSGLNLNMPNALATKEKIEGKLKLIKPTDDILSLIEQYGTEDNLKTYRGQNEVIVNFDDYYETGVIGELTRDQVYGKKNQKTDVMTELNALDLTHPSNDKNVIDNVID
jgi:hypothetical protein